MAIFRSFLLGDVKKSVANLTMYAVKGINIVRGKPLNVRNPRTDKQRVQRAKMKVLVKLAKSFRPVLKISYPESRGQLSSINCFIQDNMGTVTVDEQFEAVVDFKKLVCSSGELKVPKVVVTYKEAEKKFAFTQAVQKYSLICNPTDVVWVVVYEKVLRETEVYELKTRAEEGEVTEELPEDWEAANCEFYVFARNAEGTLVSRTSHLTLATE